MYSNSGRSGLRKIGSLVRPIPVHKKRIRLSNRVAASTVGSCLDGWLAATMMPTPSRLRRVSSATVSAEIRTRGR